MRTSASELDVPEARVGDPNPGFFRSLLYALYDGGWLVAAVFGSPYLLWRSRRRPGFGAGVRERIGGGLEDLPRATRPRILVHAVSVGEVKAARSIVTNLNARYPGLEIVISATTDTGIQVARTIYPDHLVVRFPVDLSFCVKRFLRRIAPAFVILVELEIWPNFLRQCNRDDIPVAVVNGRITEISQSRYFVFRKLLPEFNRISLFCVQSEEYADRFRRLDVAPGRIFVTGNIKVDGLRTGVVDPGEELTRLLGGRTGQGVLVCGSTHEPEERWLAEVWRDSVPDLRLILVPRHPPRASSVVVDLRDVGIRCQLLSRLRSGDESPDPSLPLVVDTIGELERIYALAQLVFVGGTLIPHGGQNMLEPAAQGKPCIFGSHLRNFTQEAGLLLDADAAMEVADLDELRSSLKALRSNPERARAMGERGMASVASQGGATAITIDALARLALDRLESVGEAGPAS